MVSTRALKINEVLGISQDYKVVKLGRQGDCDVAYLGREARERECPARSGHARVKGRRQRKDWHTPAHNCPLMLMIEVTRMQCTKCKKSWNERHEMVGMASIHMSVDVQDAISAGLMDKKPVKATSEKNNPSPHMVNCVLDQAVLDASYLPEHSASKSSRPTPTRARWPSPWPTATPDIRLRSCPSSCPRPI